MPAQVLILTLFWDWSFPYLDPVASWISLFLALAVSRNAFSAILDARTKNLTTPYLRNKLSASISDLSSCKNPSLCANFCWKYKLYEELGLETNSVTSRFVTFNSTQSPLCNDNLWINFVCMFTRSDCWSFPLPLKTRLWEKYTM